VIIGRLGPKLPTRRLKTVATDAEGSFSVRFELVEGPRWGTAAFRAHWRVITAFYGGSASAWSTTAFDVIW